MSSSTDSLRALSPPICIEVSSSSSDDDSTPLHFKVRLYHDYKQSAILPKFARLGEGSRWIVIKTRDNATYKVQMVDDGGVFLLERGWSILAALENLQEVDKLMFRLEAANRFDMWIHSPPNHPPPIGFSAERVPRVTIDDLALGEVLVNQGGVHLNAGVSKAIERVWNASSINGPMYVCRLKISPTAGRCLIFNKSYSSLIPKNHRNIAMRFVGSDLIIPGAIRTYTDRNARMVMEWPVYASQHQLTIGSIFVCKIHRGPAVWEFIGSSARHV